MWALLRRYRELTVVVLLLVVPFLLFTAGSKAPGKRNAADRAVLWLSSPIQRAVVWTVEGVQDLFHNYVYLVGVEDENEQLRRKVLRLQGEVDASQEIAVENTRLRRLLDLSREDGLPPIVAPVIGVGVTPTLARTLRLGRGKEGGIRVDQPVVAPEGVVGSVVAVGQGWSDTLLLADPNSAVAAQVVRSRARVTVRGTGALDEAVLENALRTDDIVDGDLLVTSGTGGIYPKGLPVGRVTGVTRGQHGLFQSAKVIPVVDLARLDEVMILADTIAPAGLATGPEGGAESP
ncbi:MAG: rod shape-determining protein MreC [Deltaproteobacteria bacterium]|nr:rod shape-determining protein MreC [Deltaproteobacteria bacterium]